MATKGTAPPARKSGSKSAAAFRTISEVAKELVLPQHVLRFWESKFTQIRPLKRGGGRRYYRPEDIQLLIRIRDLLYSDGYTIKGVQKLLRDGEFTRSKGTIPSPTPAPTVANPDREAKLRSVLKELEDIRSSFANAG